jgi:predicted RNA polymerase sigma factor
MWLGRLVTSLLPNEPEALGLLALMLHAEARRAARRNAQGEYVPLAEQDPAAWDTQLIEEAETLLVRASTMGSVGAISWKRQYSRPMWFAGAPAPPTGQQSSSSMTRCRR